MAKIAFVSGIVFTDCDFPLIHSFLERNIDIKYFLFCSDQTPCGGVIDLRTENLRPGIYKASKLHAFCPYKNYLDLDCISVVYGKKGWSRLAFSNWLIFIQVLWMFWGFRPNILHLAFPLSDQWKFLYYVTKKIVGVVHDPLRHSCFTETKEEKDRIEFFNKCDKLVLLNEVQLNEFINTYNIDKKKIFLNKLGEYECLRICGKGKRYFDFPYVLFFGQIQNHKGIEFLCESMDIIHDRHPDVHLVIAGKGKMYFDLDKFQNKKNIHLINDFITIEQLADLLKYCEFSVCYYRDATQSGCVQTAFSANVPLIVSDVGALPKAVTNNITGIVVPACNSQLLASAMDELLSTPVLLARMKDNIKSIWRPTMAWEAIAEEYLNIYTANI
jgi:glycosyltransferase involved in cell wall biosynthesis